MPRIRTIKPEFWIDPALTECSLSARLLFIGLWTFSDDNGNLEAHPKKIKMQIFPGDDIEIEKMLVELERGGFIIPYAVDSKKYFNIKNFRKHQVINRPSASTIPAFEDSWRTHGGLMEDSMTDTDTDTDTEGKGKDKDKDIPVSALEAAEKREALLFDFEAVWNLYPLKAGKTAALRHFRATVKKQADYEAIRGALKKYLAHLKANDWKRPQNGSTWFNQWRDWIDWQEPQGGNGQGPMTDAAGRELKYV